eukprot:COSAG02_NODE_35885_length_462_cov_0.710744_2_plen_26_part_01
MFQHRLRVSREVGLRRESFSAPYSQV